ncbi:hypothetical protein [Streptomyces sp. NPDC056188]|uniref:hypothetical protein n=1 Tax=Streptomyces sp. NPDC056188 TaxID=3345740 RepID=UPI0035DCEC9B
MDTYAVRGAARKTTGHYRRPGTTTLYCGKPAGGRNGIFNTVRGWKMCTRCVTAEALDRAEAEATAAASSGGTFKRPLCTLHGHDCDDNPRRRHIYRPTEAMRTAARAAKTAPARRSTIVPEFATLADEEARHAAALVTEAEATEGTWRGQWIGERATTTTPALFDLPSEQGALFA